MAEVRRLQVDELTVKVFSDRSSMGKAAAEQAAGWIRQVVSEKGEANIIFAAAPSQNEFLASLCTQDVDWGCVNAFHMDEYIGLNADAPQGFANFLRRSIFDLVPFKSVNCLNCQNEDSEGECKRYEKLLLEYPADIIFMGVGENAHLAFCDPGVAFFNDPKNVKIVELAATCRHQQVNDGCFATLEEVPTHAISLTVPIMMRVPYMMLVAPTKLKAQAIHDTVLGPVNEMVPASVVRTHKGGATLYTDEPGASLI